MGRKRRLSHGVLPQRAFCSQHGELSQVDEDGLCPGCGATCMGDAIDALLAERDHLKEVLRQCLEVFGAEGAVVPPNVKDLREARDRRAAIRAAALASIRKALKP